MASAFGGEAAEAAGPDRGSSVGFNREIRKGDAVRQLA
jgi:hypothetical protein